MAKRARAGDPLLAVGYLRVSTEDQNLGPDAQRSALEAWAARAGARIAAIHEDHGVSGATPLEERPGLLAALERIRELGAGVLVAAKRDRIGRDVVVVAMIERALAKLGAAVRTCDGASDGAGPEGGLMRGIVDTFSAYERELIRARTRAALHVKKCRGERVGAVPFGYRVGADGVRLEADAVEQAIIVAARELHARGQSLRAVGAELAARGMLARSGRPLGPSQIARIVATSRVA